jgi:hypothetical protein
MKKITLLLVGFFCCLSVLAGEVTEEQALQKAQQVLKGKQLLKPRKVRARHAAKTENAYYVFNAEQNGGFVVIAGNDLMPEVLGYAEQGNLDLSKAPDNVRWLMDYYAEVAQSLKSKPVSARRRTVKERTELIALMNTEWDQAGLYQQHCPEVNGEKTLTGCVATAMAQVVNFFQWPLNNVRESVGYMSNKDDKEKPQIELDNLPARKFNWFNMSDDDIAWLMRYCGQSVLMGYNLDESTAYSSYIPGALISVFNFSKGADIVERKEFTDEEWEQALYQEIELGRPVIYSGYNDKTGHTFVLHGYKDGKFLVNWGWGGQMDGYFALTALTPGGMDYTENQNAVVGIQPASNNDINYDEKPEIGFREVTVEKQGQLAELLPESERYLISRLKISGEFGGKDLDVIHDMSEPKYGRGTEGRLSRLDLSDARIVSGDTYGDDRNMVDDVLYDSFFAQCSTLTSIVLPKTLKEIHYASFFNTSLTSIVIPKSVTQIAGNAFELSTLTSIVVEEGNEVYYSQNNAIYEKATGNLVRGCKSSGIPEGVETVSDGAFTSADLETIVLPKSLKKIGERAFPYNRKVKDLYIPASVEKIGENAFFSCALQSITVDKDNKFFDSRDNCNAIIETATNTLLQASNATTEIPASVTAIGYNAFARLGIKKIDIPVNVVNFGSGVFEYSETATFRVHYPTPIAIKENTFNSVENGQPLNFIQKNARLIVPDGTKDLYAAAPGWNVFTMAECMIIEESEYEAMRQYTVELTEAGTLQTMIPADKKNIVEELKVVGPINAEDLKYLKEMCGLDGMLTSIDLSDATIVEGDGNAANELPVEAFQSTFSLEHIVLPKNLEVIGSLAFMDSGIKEFVLPKTVKELGRDIFYYARDLSKLSVEEGNPVFDSRDNCNAIIETATNTLRIGCVNTVIPNTVTALGDMAFSGKPGLEVIDIPNSVTSLGWAAFWADTELTKVKLSANITSLSDSPFGGCDRITSFVIDEGNSKYDSRDNCNAIIETATNTLVQGFSTTVIPDGVECIASAAFRSLSTLTEIEIPASVKKIESEAFLYCNQMTKVVSHIKKPFAVSSMVFAGDNMKIAKLYVPYGTKEAYASTPGWDNFPNIIEMDAVEGEFAKNAASVVSTDFGKAYAALNGKVSVPVTLAGEGTEPINSIDYTITTGNATTEHHLELNDPVTFMMSREVLVPLEADATVGENDKTFTLTKVNGVANESTAENMQATGKLVTVAKKPKVVPVVEEATGTWCGWCARGIPGLALLNKVYMDDVITIAVHGGSADDPMKLDDYQLNASSYPSCQINRGDFLDPYYGSGSQAFGISREVEAAQRIYVPAGIEVTAEWADDSQQAIKAKTTTTFVDNVENANYRIAYILVEDGMKGSTPEWYQSNYYAGSSLNDPNLVNLTKGESKITNVAYNYIPVAAYEPFNGIEGSLPATIVKDEAMEHDFTIDISGNTRIQDKKKLSVIALLLDKETGKITNAAKFKFDKGSDSGNGGFVFFEEDGNLPGDANGDGQVNDADIQEMVKYIMGRPSSRFMKKNADVNNDEKVNVADIVRVASMIP